MKKTIHVYNTDMSTPGKIGVSKKVSRRDLERTLLDILTMDEDIDFLDAQEIVEELATFEALVEMIWGLENEIITAKEILENYGF